MAIRHKSHRMRVDKQLATLLIIVNYERVKRGINPLSASQFTRKLARKYVNNKDLIHDDFIKIP